MKIEIPNPIIQEVLEVYALARNDHSDPDNTERLRETERRQHLIAEKVLLLIEKTVWKS